MSVMKITQVPQGTTPTHLHWEAEETGNHEVQFNLALQFTNLTAADFETPAKSKLGNTVQHDSREALDNTRSLKRKRDSSASSRSISTERQVKRPATEPVAKPVLSRNPFRRPPRPSAACEPPSCQSPPTQSLNCNNPFHQALYYQSTPRTAAIPDIFGDSYQSPVMITQATDGPISRHVLVDRVDLSQSIFVKDDQSNYDFWETVEKIHVHMPRQLNWTDPSNIESALILDQLFRGKSSVLIPLQDLGRVEHTWTLLNLSMEAEVVRLREDLETAVAAVHGPQGCRMFPYREPTEYNWEETKNNFMWSWMYMRYQGSECSIPFEKMWDDITAEDGRIWKFPKHEWVIHEVAKMPQLEEVLFICLPGFTPPGRCRRNPAIMVTRHNRLHTPLSPGSDSIQRWETVGQTSQYPYTSPTMVDGSGFVAIMPAAANSQPGVV